MRQSLTKLQTRRLIEAKAEAQLQPTAYVSGLLSNGSDPTCSRHVEMHCPVASQACLTTSAALRSWQTGASLPSQIILRNSNSFHPWVLSCKRNPYSCSQTFVRVIIHVLRPSSYPRQVATRTRIRHMNGGSMQPVACTQPGSYQTTT